MQPVTPQRKYDVAISFAREDSLQAEALAAALKRLGVSVYYYQFEKGKGLGTDLHLKLTDIFQNQSKYCVILISKDYLNEWTEIELNAAWARKIKNREKDYILPVRLDQTEIPGLLPTMEYLEWPPDNEESIARAIASKLNKRPAVVKDAKGLAYYVHYLPFIVILALTAVLLAPVPLLSPAIRMVFGGLFFGSLVWILCLAVKASRAFGTTEPVPAPSDLWQSVFKQLLPQQGQKHQGAGLEILVICDRSTEETFEQINTHYTPDIVEIRKFTYSSSNFDKSDLKNALETADAVYFFCTDEIHRGREPYDTVNNWGVDHSHKPILAVNFRPPESRYQWTFNLIPQTEAVPGVWRLLARSTERASQLRELTNTFQRVWVVTIIIALFYLGLMGLSSWRASSQWVAHLGNDNQHREEDKKLLQMESGDLERLRTFRNEAAMVALRNTIESLPKTEDSLNDKEGSPGVLARQALTVFAAYLKRDMENRSMAEETGSISFWRKYTDPKTGKPYIVKVAKSGSKDDCFPGVLDPGKLNSIAACAVESTSFVRWRRYPRNEENASLSRQGKQNGYGIKHEGEAAIQLEGGEKCGFVKGENIRNGTICVGIGDGSLKSGICLSTDNNFPKEEWIKHHLYEAVSIMEIIPDSLLISEKHLKICRGRKYYPDSSKPGFELTGKH